MIDPEKCLFIVPERVYRTGVAIEAHRCKFDAVFRGFCHNHNPDKKRETLLRRIEATKAKLAALQSQLAALRHDVGDL